MTIVPSPSLGTNSEPRFRPSPVVATVIAPTKTRVDLGKRSPRWRRGWKRRCASRSVNVSLSDIRRGRPSEASTGMSVSDSTIDAARAKMTVSAIGRNNLPSTPWSVRIGR